MKHSERMLFRKSALLKPLACIALAASALSIVPVVNATTKNSPGNDQLWCNGNGPNGTTSDYAAIPGFPGDTLPFGPSTTDPNFGLNPPDTWDEWGKNTDLTNPPSLGLAYETQGPYDVPSMVNDVYAVQLNYWNSVVNANPNYDRTGYSAAKQAPFGHSGGHSCLMFSDLGTSRTSKFLFTITYPAGQSNADYRTKALGGQTGEVEFQKNHPMDYPTYVPYAAGLTVGGPTGYVSTYKGCSWDGNSCTMGSSIPKGTIQSGPDKGKPTVPAKSTDINVFPERLSDVTSIPTSWSIDSEPYFGNPFNDASIWDASWDIWFDKTAHTAEGQAPYDDGGARGQNDGLEIMVWMNSHGSYVDDYDGKGQPKGVAGRIQPTGSIREQAMIDGVLYDVWVGRLNNPYFGYVTGSTTPDGKIAPPVIKPAQVVGECPTTIGKAHDASATLCGVEWNVVSFVATKQFSSGQGGSGTRDYRKNQASINAKIFTDYLLGIDRGPRAPNDPGSWSTYQFDNGDGKGLRGLSDSTQNRKTNHTPLLCPASNKDQSLTAATSNCIDPSWFLMSVQAGFETWNGGNGLRSTNFNAYVMTTPSVIGSIGVNNQGQPIITGNSIDIVYADPGCKTVNVNNSAHYSISGYDAKGNFVSTPNYDMLRQKPDGSFEAWLIGASSIVGKATITYSSSCGANAVLEVFIDPSGQVFYADGVTPLPGATVTLSYSPSGNSAGPYVVVPQNATNPIMQPNDNTTNPMTSASNGGYGWNVIPGWYKVTATFNGVTVTTSAQQVTATHPITGLNIVLPVTAPPPAARPARVTSQWVVNNVVRQLTSPDSTANDAEMHAQPTTSSWNTQDWVIEPVAGNNHVRLKNIRTGNYLTAQGTTPVEYAKVVGDSFRSDWTSEEWIVEPVAATNDVRLKNAFNLRYLTVVDNSTYSTIQMQTLSSQNWASQRWVIQ